MPLPRVMFSNHWAIAVQLFKRAIFHKNLDLAMKLTRALSSITWVIALDKVMF